MVSPDDVFQCFNELILFERSEFLIATSLEKKFVRVRATNLGFREKKVCACARANLGLKGVVKTLWL